MNPTEMKLDQILEGRDENLEDINKDDNGDDANHLDNDAGASNGASDDNVSDNGDSSGKGDDADDGDNDSGYTAKDLEQEDDKPTNEPAPPAKNLDPETQFIADNLPDITTRIVQDGKVQEVSIKSWTQLPPDVEFASKRDELAFINAINAQENRARELQQEFRTTKNTEQAQEFEQRENAMIRDDITELQNQNLIPKFKATPGQSGFEDDSGYKAAQEVLDFMNKKNEDYLKNFNKGSAYRHIGFAEAYYMMPKTQQKQVEQQAQKQEDQNRHQKANNVAGSESNSNPNIRKATVRQGTSLDDIVNRIENTW